jgi:hypothetical protein
MTCERNESTFATHVDERMWGGDFAARASRLQGERSRTTRAGHAGLHAPLREWRPQLGSRQERPAGHAELTTACANTAELQPELFGPCVLLCYDQHRHGGRLQQMPSFSTP